MPGPRLRWPALLVGALIAACAACAWRKPPEERAMIPSVTYLHLLRHTPFFTALNTQQLRWVIDHSREWEAQPGAIIAGTGATVTDEGYWVLLDGRWTLGYRNRHYADGHAGAGKWFDRRELPEAAQLVANEHSYVMLIPRDAMAQMLAQGFPFDRHLLTGRAFYARLAAENADLHP
ncbi:hypothetical protein ACIQSO_23250 [Pseudomonas putida]|uniref:hypothetical protein n=1 Tax=Pseudomonas putida TaxID=303 RepID=UPI00383B72BD